MSYGLWQSSCPPSDASVLNSSYDTKIVGMDPQSSWFQFLLVVRLGQSTLNSSKTCKQHLTARVRMRVCVCVCVCVCGSSRILVFSRAKEEIKTGSSLGFL